MSDFPINPEDPGEEDQIDEGPFCDVCLDGNCYDANEIIFCDKCDVPVHQHCYGVNTIPKGSWFCYVCSEKKDVSKTTCVLCSNKGGAYKKTHDGKWVHGLCATWIPEIFSKDQDGVVMDISALDSKRAKLKCALCSDKGHCIQCAYGRCATAVHPWCLLHNPQGFTHRIVRNEDDITVWEVFCTAHASAVSDPIKYKKKSMNTSTIDDNSLQESSKKAARQRKKVTYQDDVDDDQSFDDADDETYGIDSSNRRNHTTKPSSNQICGKSASRSKLNMTESNSRKGREIPTLYSLHEWPGQSEGDALDLDHFWKVVSMSFPESHSDEWIDFVLKDILKLTHLDLDQEKLDSLLSLPTLGEFDEIDEKIELDTFGSDRDRTNALDFIKRDRILSRLYQNIHALAPYPEDSSALHEFNYIEEEKEFLIRDSKCDSESSKETVVAFNEKKEIPISCVLDSLKRYLCKFRFSKDNHDPNSNREDVKDYDDWNLLVGPSSALNERGDHIDGSLLLDSFEKLKEDSPVYLHDKIIISQDEDDVIARLLKGYQKAYQRIRRIILEKISELQLALPSWIDSQKVEKEFRAPVEQTYLKQRIWKKVANSCLKGIREQDADFNKLHPEVIPASWTVGREVEENDEVVDEAIEDSICMCCFDGTSTDMNSIIFCDGCNAAMHQACYGITEIPEGNYYCDRCCEVQSIIADSYGRRFSGQEIAELVRCCLCTQQFGGMKATTDGRWVHICCAIWSKDAIITNLIDMGPIDISNVSVSNKATIFNPLYPLQSSNSCASCGDASGFMVQCCGSESTSNSDHPCGARFHPLCGWFEGSYVTTNITDPTFQGLDRDGLYPSCLNFQFYCHFHCPPSYNNKESRQNQKALRSKYLMKKEYFEIIPGNTKSRRRTKARQANENVRSDRSANRNVVEKDLQVDIYDAKICGICCGSSDGLCTSREWQMFNSIDIPEIETSPADDAFNSSLENLELNTGELDKILCQECSSDQITAIAPSLDEEHLVGIPTVLADNNQTETVEIEDVNIQIDASKESHEVNPDDAVLQDTRLLPSISTQKFPISSGSLSCRSCQMSVHISCLGSVTEFSQESINSDTIWECETCATSQSNIRCTLCPRKGGFFLFTTNQSFVHVLCARYSPGNIKFIDATSYNQSQSHISQDNEKESNIITFANPLIKNQFIVDIRTLPKENRKMKCVICNRKNGVCERCSVPNCPIYFHPLCAERSGGGYTCSRLGNKFSYCLDHLPLGVRRINYQSASIANAATPVVNRYWVDGFELMRLRYTLERSRVLFDSIVRREKVKKLMNKADGEYFNLRFQKLIQKGTGKKYVKITEVLHGLDVDNLVDDVFDFNDDDVIEDRKERKHSLVTQPSSSRDRTRRSRVDSNVHMSTAPEDPEWIPFEPKLSNEDDLMISIHDEEVRISSTFLKPASNTSEDGISSESSRVDIPQRLFVAFAGFEFDKVETVLEGGSRSFIRKYKSKMNEAVEASRLNCGIFTSFHEANEFRKKMPGDILRHLKIPDNAFQKEMSSLGYGYEFPKKVKGKKGYHILEEDETVVSYWDKPTASSGRKRSLAKSEEVIPSLASPQKSSKGSRNSESIEKETIVNRGRSKRSSHTEREESEGQEVTTPSLKKRRRDTLQLFSPESVTSTASDMLTGGDSQVTVADLKPTSKFLIPFQTHSKLHSKLIEDNMNSRLPWVSSILPSQKSKTISHSFPLSFESLYVDQIESQITENLSFIERLYDIKSLPDLERCIQDILNVLDMHQVPSQLHSSSPTKSYRPSSSGRKKKRKSNKQLRYLCEDFSEIPDDSFPAYYDFVRHVITMESLKEQLKNHKYRSLSSFRKNFFEMLNNARAVTPIDSKTWKDSEALEKLFNDVFVSSAQGSMIESPDSIIVRELNDKVNPEVSDGINVCCGECSKKFLLENWPQDFTIKADHKWICPKCLPKDILGQKVMVWWHDDAVSYSGIINAQDSVTKKYRVFYDDGEWEFISLSSSPVLFQT